MDINNEQQQREEFKKILFDLAKSQELLENKYDRVSMFKRLESLYRPEFGKEFRHYYSDIFSVLSQIHNNSEMGNLDILGQNLQLIMMGYQAKNYKNNTLIDISDSIKKLYDHVNLDISRINYWDAVHRHESGEQEITDLHGKITAFTLNMEIAQNKQKALENAQHLTDQQLNETKKEYAAIEHKLDNSQKEYITILGIFASVVLAFTGGIAFSTSVLNNIAQASIYRTILISLIIGLVLINVIFAVFYYINKFMLKKAKIWPMIISNFIFIVLLGITVLAWNFGWVESRDSRIYDSEKSVVTEEIERN